MTAATLFALLLAATTTSMVVALPRLNRARPELAQMNRARATLTALGLVAEAQR